MSYHLFEILNTSCPEKPLGDLHMWVLVINSCSFHGRRVLIISQHGLNFTLQRQKQRSMSSLLYNQHLLRKSKLKQHITGAFYLINVEQFLKLQKPKFRESFIIFFSKIFLIIIYSSSQNQYFISIYYTMLSELMSEQWENLRVQCN